MAGLPTVDIERVVLSDVFRDRDAIPVALSMLRPEHFQDTRCRATFTACQSLDATQQPIDAATVGAELERTGKLAEVGGLTWLADIYDDSMSSVNVRTHAKLVLEQYARRAIADYCGHLSQSLDKGTGDITEFLGEAQAKLTGIIAECGGLQDEFRPMMEVALEASEFVDKLHKGGPVGIATTGLRNLDAKIGALRPRDYVIIAGRTSMGKTALATCLVNHIAGSGVPVAFLSLEMGDVPLVIRMACAKSHVSLSDVLRGITRPDDLLRFSDALSTVASYPVHWDRVPALNPAGLRVKCEKAIRQHGVRVIILDYIQLMNGPKKAENREKEVAAISRTCKGIARDFGVCFVGLSQLRRNGDQRPNLSDLRDSGSLEQDADLVLFPWREIPRDAVAQVVPALIDVAKQRNGPVGDCPCVFHLQSASFENEGQ